MIIDIRDNIPDYIACRVVEEVCRMGKISKDTKGNQYYCWCTIFNYNKVPYRIITRKNNNQPSFIVELEK